jgi:molybdopterin converting factor small subunit
MAIVTFRYWAAAKEAAGVSEETIRAETLAEALATACGNAASGNAATGIRPARDACLNSRLRDVLARSSFLIDGHPVGIRPPEAVTLSDASVIEVLPPFAGG